MAYNAKNLSVLAYANGFTLWHYTTADTAAVVDTEGYFDDASGMLRTGDMILANVNTGGGVTGGIYIVTGNAAGVVDVDDITSVGGTDTD